MLPAHPRAKTSNLKELRQAKGLSQYGLAVLAGTSPTTIGAIERWGLRPSAPVRQRIAQALDLSEEAVWPGVQVGT